MYLALFITKWPRLGAPGGMEGWEGMVWALQSFSSRTESKLPSHLPYQGDADINETT